jgi:hypothetical protein
MEIVSFQMAHSADRVDWLHAGDLGHSLADRKKYPSATVGNRGKRVFFHGNESLTMICLPWLMERYGSICHYFLKTMVDVSLQP